MSERTIVQVSRKWGDTPIEAFISEEGVGARVTLASYLNALVEEVGNPSMVMTKAGLLTRLTSASEVVLAEMKSATRAVV